MAKPAQSNCIWVIVAAFVVAMAVGILLLGLLVVWILQLPSPEETERGPDGNGRWRKRDHDE